MRIVDASARPAAPSAQSGPSVPATTMQTVQTPNDLTTIAGIPEAELTPKVRAAIEALLREVAKLREELKETRHRIAYLEKLADEDTLVPVANRRSFVRELSRSLALSQRYGTPSTLLYLDVDGMKRVNDEFGHAAGDAVLKHVADVLLSNTRKSDVVGRLGGDEFAVLLQQADEARGRSKGEELAAKIAAQPVRCNGHEICVSVSCGIYSTTGNEQPGDVIDAADRAMYARKRATTATPGEAPPDLVRR